MRQEVVLVKMEVRPRHWPDNKYGETAEIRLGHQGNKR